MLNEIHTVSSDAIIQYFRNSEFLYTQYESYSKNVYLLGRNNADIENELLQLGFKRIESNTVSDTYILNNDDRHYAVRLIKPYDDFFGVINILKNNSVKIDDKTITMLTGIFFDNKDDYILIRQVNS